MDQRHVRVVQSRAYLAWINAHLREYGQEPLTDLVMDLADGVALCHLVSSVTRQKVRGFQSRPRSHAHKMANISLALDTADACGVPGADQLDPQDILDMNTDAVLAFIWALIEHFHSATEDALRKRLSDLAGAPVDNLTTAWSDGVLLAKMIDRKRDRLINPETLDASQGEKNVGDALYLLETHFKMPHILDASDVAKTPDERAMRTFLPFVADAVSGTSTVGSGASEGPRVFSRASTAAPEPVTPSRSSVAAAPSPASSSSLSAERSPFLGGSSASPASYSSPAPVVQAAPRPAATGSSATVRLTPLKSFSQSIASKYPGIKFDAVTVDGRSADGQLPCQQCGGALGDGRCFKFRIPDKGMHWVHSRCFDCSTCRKDFVAGFFYLSDDHKQLLCTPHYMETKGEVCKSCSEPIVDFFVAALDAKFHETCFHCHGGCNKDFQEPKFFEGPGKMPFCPECFAASEGRVCKRCGAGVPNPIKALDAFWHDRCFKCDLCHQEISGSFIARDGLPLHSACLDKQSSPAAAQASTTPVKPPSPYNSPSPNSRGSYSTVANGCAGCGKSVPSGKAVTVSGKRYHEACFKCHYCKKTITGSFFSVEDGFCCPSCEHLLPPVVEGGNVPCGKCGKTLVGSCIKALGKEYHADCWTCTKCNKKIEGGFKADGGKPYCAGCL